MKILVVGGGGREHALAWRLAQGLRVQKVFVAPGNAGTNLEDGVENLPITDINELLAFAIKEDIHFTVVGPEVPLAAGIVDVFRAGGQKIFGPTKAAAQLESSKDFAKQFMMRHNIPTAFFASFSDIAQARAYVEKHGAPIVVKADGLAAGKGVVVAMTKEEAFAAIDLMLADNKLEDPRTDVSRRAGDADPEHERRISGGARVVIEEFLTGEEASFIVMIDGKNTLALATSQDHKRLKDGDQGPNTGGMGAYSPAPVITPTLHARALREVIKPVILGMEKEGITYTGFLYAGLMIDAKGDLKVLEFNCRMGDPETQPIMMRLKSDLSIIMEHGIAGTLNEIEAEWDIRSALGVVMAAHNYPGTPRLGDVISGIEKATDDMHVFHAGTALKDGKVVSNGGRVLCVTALGGNISMAKRRAYEALNKIEFDGMQYRNDIGYRAIGSKK